MKLSLMKPLLVGTCITMAFMISACGDEDKKLSTRGNNAEINSAGLVAEDGKAVFDRNCSRCHMQGGNMMAPDKTLSKKDLKKHGKYSEEAIYQLLREGVKGTAMMSFEHLGEDKLRAVTSYVMEQAELGWSQ